MPPINWTSKWRSPSVRLEASRTQANASGSRSSRSSPSSNRPRNSSVFAHSSSSERRAISSSRALISWTRSCRRLSVRPSPARRIFWKTLTADGWYRTSGIHPMRAPSRGARLWGRVEGGRHEVSHHSDRARRNRGRGSAGRGVRTDDHPGGVSSAGAQGNGASGCAHTSEARISRSGRYVAFFSDASNLVPGDTNRRTDVFVPRPEDGKDGARERLVDQRAGKRRELRRAGDHAGRSLRRLPLARIEPGTQRSGRQLRRRVPSRPRCPNHAIIFGSLAEGGVWLAFVSRATNLVPGDTNGFRDVFMRDPLR